MIKSMGFSRPEYWNGYPFPSPADLPDLGIEPRSSALQVDFLLAELSGKPVASRDYSLIVATGFSLQWLLLLPNTGSRALGLCHCSTWTQ